jgi:hypothetical protein
MPSGCRASAEPMRIGCGAEAGKAMEKILWKE